MVTIPNTDRTTLSYKAFADFGTTEQAAGPGAGGRSAAGVPLAGTACPARPGLVRPDGRSRPILHKGEIFLPTPAYYRRSYPWLAPYHGIVQQFLLYLDSIRYKKIRIEGLAFDEGDWEWINKTFPYPSRFNEGRIKATLAKLYLLDAWQKENQRASTMMTLTTYHDWIKPHWEKGKKIPAKRVRDGWSIEKAFEILLENWRKLRWLMRYYLGPLTFVRVLEPHKMGYPHLHILLFHAIPDKVQAKIRGTWSNRYKMASWSHGLDFSFNEKTEGIESPKNYLMKYIGKDFRTGEMSPCELAFNALLWKHRYRRIDCSRDLQSVMKWQEMRDKNVIWMETGVLDQDDEYRELWKRPTEESI